MIGKKIKCVYKNYEICELDGKECPFPSSLERLCKYYGWGLKMLEMLEKK